MMATKQCPTLPAELWLRVLQNLQKEEDLPDFWTSYRQVCTTFKKAVEAIMRDNHLQMTFIRFALGKCMQSPAGMNWAENYKGTTVTTIMRQCLSIQNLCSTIFWKIKAKLLL
jgi:hypothetical protein